MSRIRQWITLPYRRYPMLTGILVPLLLITAFMVAPGLMQPESAAVDPLGRTALTLAAEHGETDRVMAMLDDGTAVDANDACGWTALMKAAANGHLDMLEALIARGANLEHRDQAGYTPLLVAVVNGREATSQALLDAGARVNAVDDEAGWSSLTWAAKDGRLALVELLIEHGAAPSHLATDGTTPLQWARDNGHLEVARCLETATGPSS